MISKHPDMGLCIQKWKDHWAADNGGFLNMTEFHRREEMENKFNIPYSTFRRHAIHNESMLESACRKNIQGAVEADNPPQGNALSALRERKMQTQQATETREKRQYERMFCDFEEGGGTETEDPGTEESRPRPLE